LALFIDMVYLRVCNVYITLRVKMPHARLSDLRLPDVIGIQAGDVLTIAARYATVPGRCVALIALPDVTYAPILVLLDKAANILI